MAHHKRRRHPNARSGCAMCKPHKKGGSNPDRVLSLRGWGRLKALDAADRELMGHRGQIKRRWVI